MTSGRIAALTEDKGPAASGPEQRQVIVAGLVTGMRTINTRRGRMAIVTLDDRTGRVDATLFSDVYEQFRDSISRDAILVMTGTLGPDDYSGGFRLNVDNVYNIDQAREKYAKRIVIKLAGGKGINGFVQGLSDVLSPYRQGGCPVIQEVLADIDTDASEVVLAIHWRGGAHTELRLPRREDLRQLLLERRQLIGEADDRARQLRRDDEQDRQQDEEQDRVQDHDDEASRRDRQHPMDELDER